MNCGESHCEERRWCGRCIILYPLPDSSNGEQAVLILYHILSLTLYPVLFYHILFYSVLYMYVLPHPTLSRPALIRIIRSILTLYDLVCAEDGRFE